MGKTNENLLPSCPDAKLLEGKVWKSNVNKTELSAWAESVENNK